MIRVPYVELKSSLMQAIKEQFISGPSHQSEVDVVYRSIESSKFNNLLKTDLNIKNIVVIPKGTLIIDRSLSEEDYCVTSFFEFVKK